MGRVMGKLAIARALGDFEFKDLKSPLLEEYGIRKPLVLAEPEIKSARLGVEDDLLLLACDGIFDVFTSEESVGFVRSQLDSAKSSQAGGDGASALPPLQRACQALVDEAIDVRMSHDNVTAVCVSIAVSQAP